MNVALICRLAIGSIFLFSGIIKLSDLVSFNEAIIRFGILPLQLVNIAAITIPAIEILSGILLLLNIYTKVSALSLKILLVLFIYGITINLINGETFECGCFGPLKIFEKISIYSIALDLVLLAMLSIVFFKSEQSRFQEKTYNYVLILGSVSLLIALPVLNIHVTNIILQNKVNFITWNDAKNIMANNDFVLLDIRSEVEYEKEHVPGAVYFSYNEFSDYLNRNKDILNSNRILIYCNSIECSLSQRAAFRFVNRGYSNVYAIRGGYEEWKEIN